MYRNLMVPVDNSMLSAANVDAAVQLAERLGARITFFHATPDLAATSDGDLLRMIAPDEFSTASLGDTNAVLSKAAASAAARGVRCETLARTSDRPAQAIVDAAQSRGCDLIVMASRGARGVDSWLHASQTERVLRRSPVALLVTRVASNDPLKPSERALTIILDEHRSIATVVRGMRDLVQEAAASGAALDVFGLKTMLTYLQAFPLQLHHPKEEMFLHRRLRERASACDQLLRELEDQHAREHELVDQTLGRLQSLNPSDASAVASLSQGVEALAEHIWRHLALEERSILPAARQHLREEDWQEMADAFEGNNDPRFGELPADEFRRLFTHIANLLQAQARP